MLNSYVLSPTLVSQSVETRRDREIKNLLGADDFLI